MKKNNSKNADRQVAGKSESRCPVSSRCGGCSMINTPMEEQLRMKQDLVEDCIGAYGKVEPIVRMKNPGRYRNKVTAVFGLDEKGHPVYGKYKAGSRDIVPVSDCLIENRVADHIIQSIYQLLPSFHIRVYDDASRQGMLRAVQIRVAHSTNQYLVTIVTNGPAFVSRRHFVEALLLKEPEITTIVQNINERTDAMVLGQAERTLYGSGYIEDILCGRRFRISSRAFYQVNSLQTQKLYNIAIDMAGLSGKEDVIDAYCGIGTIGILAAAKARKVTSIELNQQAMEDAVSNAKMNKIHNIQVKCGDAGEFMSSLAAVRAAEKKGNAPATKEVLFMDPPRSGASVDFLAGILSLRPEKIVYISCNPGTLGENLAILCGRRKKRGGDSIDQDSRGLRDNTVSLAAEENDSGFYAMQRAVPVDMFPYTNEIETCCLLIRK